MIPHDDPASEQRKQNAERRREQLEESWNETVKRAKKPVSFKDINDKVDEQDLIHAVHEELTLNQMYNDYAQFLDVISTTKRINSQYIYSSQEKERLQKLLKSKLEKFTALFWKNEEVFTSKEFTNYLHGYHNALKNNPELSEQYKEIDQEKLHKKRESFRKQHDSLCLSMNIKTRQYNLND